MLATEDDGMAKTAWTRNPAATACTPMAWPGTRLTLSENPLLGMPYHIDVVCLYAYWKFLLDAAATADQKDLHNLVGSWAVVNGDQQSIAES